MAPYKGTLVIGGFYNIVLLKDVVDGDDDFYWVYFGVVSGAQKEYMATCVGSWVPLKGFIDEIKYRHLVMVWNLNHDQDNQAI